MQQNCWSLRCSWIIACWRCPNHIFILDLTPGFNRLGKDNCRTILEIFKFWDLARLILEVYGSYRQSRVFLRARWLIFIDVYFVVISVNLFVHDIHSNGLIVRAFYPGYDFVEKFYISAVSSFDYFFPGKARLFRCMVIIAPYFHTSCPMFFQLQI